MCEDDTIYSIIAEESKLRSKNSRMRLTIYIAKNLHYTFFPLFHYDIKRSFNIYEPM